MAEPGGQVEKSAVTFAVDHAITHILAEALTLADATPKLLGRLGEALAWDTGAIWEVDPDAGMLRCADVWHSSAIEVESFDEQTRSIRFAPGVGLPGRVWAAGEPAWIVDVTKDQNFPRAQAALEVGLRGAFAFPIHGRSGILGVIEFFAREPHEPDAALLQTMAVSGAQIGQFMERIRAEERVRRSAALKTAMLESALDCVIAIDHEGRIVEFNPAAERTFGYKREDVLGEEMAALIIPPQLRDHHRRGLARKLAGGEGNLLDRRVELPAIRSDGSEFEVELAITCIGTEKPPMFTGYLRDITERKRHEQALQFLASASSVLEESLDLDTSLQAIARLTVPYLADGCMVDLLEKDGSIRRAASAAEDPSLKPVLEELRRHPIDPLGPHPIAAAMRGGETQIVPDISDAFRREIATSDEYYEALQRWPARSVVVVPLKGRNGLLGSLALASFSTERSFGAHEVSIAEELARRAAHTVENARLFEERSQFAHSLQQSLLPPRLPELPGAEVAARFQAADGDVGGDFYDVFDAGETGWVIAIGDVSGRGVQAAATSALARHTIRAAAIQATSASQILAVLNEALRSQSKELTFCTAAVSILRTTNSGAKLSLASGGHPLPLLLRPDGRVEAIGESGVLLGVMANPRLTEEQIELRARDAVVFYTDGVSHMRVGAVRFGPEELTSLVSTCADLDATATAECIDDAVVEARVDDPHDDAAILVLRILDQSIESQPHA